MKQYSRIEDLIIVLLGDWFQVAIGSLVREIDLGPAQEPEWHFMTISRWYSVGELECRGHRAKT